MDEPSMLRTVNMVTVWFLFGLLIVIGIFDLVVANRWGREATISYTIYAVSCEYPVMPLMLGLLFGHLLWPQRPR